MSASVLSDQSLSCCAASNPGIVKGLTCDTSLNRTFAVSYGFA